MLRSTRVLKRSFNWQQAVPRLFPEWGKPYQEQQVKLDALWREVATAPEKVESINWEYWQKTIKTPGAVDAIKKEYESKVWTAPVPDVYQTETQYKAALEAANKQAEFFADYNAKLDKEIAGYDKLKREVGFMALNDYAFPGSSEEWEKNLEELNPYFSAEQEAALQSIDTAALSKDLKAGKIPDFPIRAFEAVSKDGPIQTSAASIQQEFQDYAKKYGVVLPSLKEVYEAAKVKAKLA